MNGLCVLGTAIIVWLTLPAASARVDSGCASIADASEGAEAARHVQGMCELPGDGGGAGRELHDGIAVKRAGAFCRRRPTTYGQD